VKKIIPGGLLVAIEGIDGAGKSTLLPALREFCVQLGYEVISSREPTDGPWGRKLRESATTGRLSLREELDLFLDDRREHVAQKIRPALEAGKIVLLDRYYFSTAAYQGARGADPAAIVAENEQFAPPPDLVLLLDLDPQAGLSRVRVRGDAPNEFEREEELRKVREIFAGLTEEFICRIDAGRGRDEVQEAALAALKRVIREKGSLR
jgi:dTMP kinase